MKLMKTPQKLKKKKKQELEEWKKENINKWCPEFQDLPRF